MATQTDNKQASRSVVMNALKSKFTVGHMKESEQFDGTQDAIWMSGESSNYLKDKETPMFNYYAESQQYELGIHKQVMTLLDSYGWFAEWYDAGTILIFKS